MFIGDLQEIGNLNKKKALLILIIQYIHLTINYFLPRRAIEMQFYLFQQKKCETPSTKTLKT